MGRKSAKCGIYAIVHIPTKRKYVGQSKDIVLRWTVHRYFLRRGTHFSSYLQRVWNKYPESEFKLIILEICNLEDLDCREQFWMDKYAGLLMNLCKVGGSPRGWKHTTEYKERMSEIQSSISNDSEERVRRSNRCRKQHLEGRIGRRDYQVRPRVCRKCSSNWTPERTPSGTLSQSRFCLNCRPIHYGGQCNERALWNQGHLKRRYKGA
jgi:group I intron endonuclease